MRFFSRWRMSICKHPLDAQTFERWIPSYTKDENGEELPVMVMVERCSRCGLHTYIPF